MKALRIPFSLALMLSLNFARADDYITTKKGICLGGGAESQKRIESLNVGWHYNWTPTWKGRKIKDTPFVPMIWANNQWAAAALKDVRIIRNWAHPPFSIKTANSPNWVSSTPPSGSKKAIFFRQTGENVESYAIT